MAIESLPLAGFVMLAFLALPLARLRRGLLTLLAWGAHLALFGAIAGGGVFYLSPDLAPEGLAGAVRHLGPESWPELSWLIAAGLVLAVGLPVVAHIDYARRAAETIGLVARLREELLDAAVRLEKQAAPASGTQRGDVAAAVAAMRAVAGNTSRPAAPERPKLVKDTLNDVI